MHVFFNYKSSLIIEIQMIFIAERKPAPSSTAPITGFSGTATTKPLSFSPQTFGQGMSGFTSFSAGGNKLVFGAKPDSTTPTGSAKPSFNAGFQGFKPDEKTPTNTSTPKTGRYLYMYMCIYYLRCVYQTVANSKDNLCTECLYMYIAI